MNPKTLKEKTFTYPFALVCLFVFIEYSRPDFLLLLKPALVIQILLVFQLLKNMKSVQEGFRDRYFLLLGLLYLEMMIHGPIAANNHHALFKFLGMVSLLILSISIVVFADTHAKIHALLLTIVVGHLFATTRFLPLGDHFGVTGIMGDKNDFALSMNFVIPISLYLSTLSKGIRRVALLGTTTIFVMGNVATMSRGGFIGMASICLVYLITTKNIVKGIIVLVIAGAIFITFIPNTYRDEMKTIDDEITGVPGEAPHPVEKKSNTGKDRLELWKVGMRVFADHPVLGVGQGNLPMVIGSYQDFNTDMWGRSISGRAVHSLYIEMIGELGLVGAAIFLMMLLEIYKKYACVVKYNHPVKFKLSQTPVPRNSVIYIRACIASMVGVLVTGVFISVFYYSQLWIIFALASAVYAVDRKQAVASPEPIGTTVAESIV